MRVKLWPADTIARRFTITIVSAILVAVALTGIVIEFAGFGHAFRFARRASWSGLTISSA